MWVSAPAHQTRSPPSRVRIWVLAPLWKFLVWGTVTSPSACSTTDDDQGCVSGSRSSGSLGAGPALEVPGVGHRHIPLGLQQPGRQRLGAA